jgi:DNA-binding Lrp family transcriptional regulator
MEDVERRLIDVLKNAGVPLVTSEVAEKVGIDRRVVLRRLQKLAIEGKIKGRKIEAANGIWIWWV